MATRRDRLGAVGAGRRPGRASQRWFRWATMCLLGIVAGTVHPVGPGPSASAAADGEGYAVIINVGNSTSSIDRAFVSQAFLKKIRKWPQGGIVEPVDLSHASPVRQRFSVEVVGRSLEAIRVYWQQMIFSGRELPPTEMASDADVVGYVARKPGAIGYVSNRTDVRAVKVLTIR